ncbi:M35 family metallo-endopeptidase [Leptobacterium sp. I13]|uniref:M35 family metallo-endopeptidase n=1 Tax=Leptobacterium meishanense TaxID=3128904 RepID=UPI0030EC9BA4
MNISFTGGSSAQQSMVFQSHQLAITMATNAMNAINTSPNYTTWFGNGLKTTVNSNYQNAITVLNNTSFQYMLNTMTRNQLQNGLYFCYSKDSSSSNRIVLPWMGMFSQADLSVVKDGALSIIQLAVTSDTDYNLDIASDQDGAKFLAAYDPDTAIKSPINYKYFAASFH